MTCLFHSTVFKMTFDNPPVLKNKNKIKSLSVGILKAASNQHMKKMQ